MLQCCLNGDRPLAEHPALPRDPTEAGQAAVAAVRAGAVDLHVHPKNASGHDSLAPADVAAWVAAVRAAVPGVPVGVTTGAWAAGGPQERLDLVSRWTVLPDHASVNLHEQGSMETAHLLLERGVAVEAGLFLGVPGDAEAERGVAVEAGLFLGVPGDAEAPGLGVLRDSGLAAHVVRVLAEVVEEDPESGPRTAARHLPVLTALGAAVLLHGQGGSAWPVLAMAVALGLDTRIGLEDALTLPDGRPARDCAALVRAAVAAGAG